MCTCMPIDPLPVKVPLLDMCNHRASGTASVTIERVSSGEAFFVLRCGPAIACGEEIFINYGAKGNGELLRCHGFVLKENAADVCELDLGEIEIDASEGHSSVLDAQRMEERQQAVVNRRAMLRAMLRGRGRGSRVGSAPLRLFLFRGGLPPKLLPALRFLCAQGEEELAQARAALDGGGGGGGGEDDDGGCGGDGAGDAGNAPAFNWSLVDWSAEDPFAVACATAEEVAPAGVQCERRTFSCLCRHIEARLTAIQCVPEPGLNPTLPTTEPTPEKAEHQRMANVYVAGQRALLTEALDSLRCMQAKLGTETMGVVSAQQVGESGSRKRGRREADQDQ
mmetsp:Transcript_4312/g.9464  ORF Transcript_4312/g.9464 Transcript_4312/m.9464 type:complete len:338 (-) Transcript_4312:307-1320(-)